MFSNYLKGIEGIASYPLISLVVFFVFFLAMIIWWVKADKKQIKHLSEMPLD
jgi:hypothetical protein